MSSNKRIIIKLGGSVISDKTVPYSFNEKVVSMIADELIPFYPDNEIILVHGGGSYGHPYAKRYGIREGIKGLNSCIGFAKTHEAMLELNSKIINIFLERKLPVFPVAPSSIFIVKHGSIVQGQIDTIITLLETKFIPVLFGDVALSDDKGIDILSGDQIISFLAKLFKPEKVIFLMDVDGIYDNDPVVHRDAKLLPSIDKSLTISSKTSSFDVTGGINNKIEEARKLNCTVLFINGMVSGNLTKALNDAQVGTVMKRK